MKLLTLPALLTTLVLAFLATAPLYLSPFVVTLLSDVGIFALVVMGLVLLTGYAGLASLGQAAFMGVGAYTSAILTSRVDAFAAAPWLGVLAGIALGCLVAFVIGLITLRLQGHFLALATLAWGIVIAGILANWIPVTGGATGYGGSANPEFRFPPLSFFGVEFRAGWQNYYLIWLLTLLVLWGSTNLMQSRTGRAIKALRTGAVAAASFGVDVFRLKMLTFVLAAGYAALAGALFAHRERFISPSSFDLGQSIDVLIMAVIGGLSSLWGALFGAAVVIGLEEQLQSWLPRLIGRTGNFEQIAFGLVLIVVLHRARRGLLPLLARWTPSPPPSPVPDAPPLPKREPGGGGNGAGGDALLQVEGLSKRFGGLLAVNALDFTVTRGEIKGLIGPNGAGKSTVFNMITAVLRPSEGAIRFAGRPIHRLPPHRIATLGVARTFQHLNLIGSLSLLENVSLGAYTRTSSGFWRGMFALDRSERRRTRAEALRQLGRVGLAEQAFDPASSLPLGKQRLVEVARALMADPELLLLDEPAAGLRKHEKRELVALIRRLRDDGVTVLLVEHDMEVVMELADRIVVVNYGTKLAEGSPAEVRRDPAVLEAYLGYDAAEAARGSVAPSSPAHDAPDEEGGGDVRVEPSKA